MIRSLQSFGQLFLLSAILPFSGWSQMTRLTFRPIASEYSTQLDRLIMISSTPNQLHIYDAAANADTTVPLTAGTPLSLSISADGTHAAVAFATFVSYVNLNSGIVEASFPFAVASNSYGAFNPQVVLGDGYIYVLGSPISSISIGTGAITTMNNYGSATGRYNSTLKAIYGYDAFASLVRYDVSAGPIASSSSYSFSTYPQCGPAWLSPDGKLVYTGCGTVFNASADTLKDRSYASTIQGLSRIQFLSQSADNRRIAAIPAKLPSYYLSSTGSDDRELQLFDGDFFNPVGRIVLAPFTVGGNSFDSHGKAVFFKSDSSSIYVVAQADTNSGLLNDYAIQTIPLSHPVACSVSLSSASGTTDSFGYTGSIDVTAGTNCLYTATSNNPWIRLISGDFGAGMNRLTFEVTANSGTSARVGTVSIGDQTLTISQTALSGSPTFLPLSFKVAAADYSNSLDRLVLASANSNELHVFNPLTSVDQIVALPLPPLSVSVRPDGLSAAVGANGYVSIVNLQTLTVDQTVAVPDIVTSVVLAANGYLYGFSSTSNNRTYSLNIAANTLTSLFGNLNAAAARLNAGGTSIYASGYSPLKLDITAGSAKATPLNSSVSTCSNLWLSQDGTRMFTACGAVYRTSDSNDDLQPNGSFSANSGIGWAAESSIQKQTAVITSSYPIGDTTVQIYDDAALTFLNQLTLPRFTSGAASFAGHGRYIFWNAAATKLFAVEQADSAAGILSDFAVDVINPLTIPQDCTYTLNQTSPYVNATAGTATFRVVAEQGCTWTASTSSTFLSVASGASGSGSGTATLSVAANPVSMSRNGTATIANKSVNIQQNGFYSCINSFGPRRLNLPSGGGSASFAVSASLTCSWPASSDASWITITNGAAGYGNGTVSVDVAPNTDTASRTRTLNISGTLVTIVQGGTSSTGTGGLRFVPITPCRVADTRTQYQFPVTPGYPRTFYLANVCGIPSNAASYALNVTAVPQGKLGYLTIWAANETQPLVSTLNSYDGRVRANAAIVNADQYGAISVYVTDTTDLVLDVNGYFVNDATKLAFFPLTPCRISDTRLAPGSFGAPAFAAEETRTIPVRASSCNVPAEAQAYSLNFTVVPKTKLGWITAWPTGKSKPLASTLNAPTGSVTANAALLPAGTDGSIDVYTTDQTEMVIDIDGYFAPAAPGGLSLYPVASCRVLDTRVPGGAQNFTGILDVNVKTSGCSVPASAEAFVFNATAVPAPSLGWLSLWPTGTTQPLVSTLNASDGQVTANMAITPASAGSVSAFASHSTYLILDIASYFAP